MKKLAALLLSALMMTSSALAAIKWPNAVNDGQRQLHTWVENANAALLTLGEGQIDMVYELYSAFASLGMDGADTPDTVEMYLTLGDTGVHSLQLRVSDSDRFARIAAACIHAVNPVGTAVQQALQVTDAYRAAVQAAPENSFEEDVVTLQGDQPRAYFAYYPNQYADGRNWMQMTLIFPRPGSEGAAFIVPATPAPDSAEPGEDDLQGYFSEDNYNHLEVFVTATPEPDSAAME